MSETSSSTLENLRRKDPAWVFLSPPEPPLRNTGGEPSIPGKALREWQISNPKILPGHLKMEKDKLVFSEKYGDYFKRITDSLGLDENLSLALIGQESRFVSGVEKWGSGGYMQLTKNPFDDLALRPQFFAEYYKKIGSDIPPNAPDELKELIAIFQEWPEAYARINPLISKLTKKKSDPILNITIGSVYLAGLEKTIDKIAETVDIHSLVKKRINILWSGSFVWLVANKVREILPHAETQDVKMFLNSKKDDPDFHKTYMQLRKYNGWPGKYRNGIIQHKDIYAAVVLSVAELSKKEKSWKNAIPRFHSSTSEST